VVNLRHLPGRHLRTEADDSLMFQPSHRTVELRHPDGICAPSVPESGTQRAQIERIERIGQRAADR
jgi:hypothetical protein